MEKNESSDGIRTSVDKGKQFSEPAGGDSTYWAIYADNK